MHTSCVVLVIITGATVFGHFMAISTILFALADWIINLAISPIALMGVIIFLYCIGGFFLDSMALVVVTIPIFFPVAMQLGFDPICFGVIIKLRCVPVHPAGGLALPLQAGFRIDPERYFTSY